MIMHDRDLRINGALTLLATLPTKNNVLIMTLFQILYYNKVKYYLINFCIFQIPRLLTGASTTSKQNKINCIYLHNKL